MYPKIFKIRIGMLPLIPSPFLNARASQFASYLLRVLWFILDVGSCLFAKYSFSIEWKKREI